MNSPSDGGPAFPCDWKDFSPTTGEQVAREQYFGMSLRAYFSVQIINGLLSNASYMTEAAKATDSKPGQLSEMLSKFSVIMADALMEELNK
jgi:hypothetical protein